MTAALSDSRVKGILFGLAASVSFGVSAPLAKLLLPATSPLMLAALLYLGAGIAVSLVRLAGYGRAKNEASVRRADIGWVAGVIVLGGIAGPVLMLYGLERVSGVTGSLLLNLEAPFTIVIATLFFREHLGRRASVAATLIVGGAIFLGYQQGDLSADAWGVASLAAACACWALDNNFTQRLTLRDPIAVVRLKTLGAGGCMLALATGLGEHLPSASVAVSALVLGSVSYGLSVLLDAYALRFLGAAREAALFATAPFIGALASVPLLGERFGVSQIIAGAVIGTGVVLLIRERHHHEHTHEESEHDHRHVHDEHHQHSHAGDEPVAEPHSHPHRHVALTHDHVHTPDLHHRHGHSSHGHD